MTRERESILIVDDEESIRTVLEEKLSDLYECRTAESGDEALKVLAARPADMVLCDLKMPGRDGIQTLGEVVKLYPDTAVLMITAVYDVDVAVRALKLGAFDYITKPFHLEEVAIAVARALARRRLRIENREYQTQLEGKVREQTERIQGLLYQEARSRVLEAIYRASEAVGSFDDAEKTLGTLLRSLIEIVGAGRGAVFTRGAGGELRFASTIGVDEQDRDALLAFGRELTGREETLCATGDSFPSELRQHSFVRDGALLSLAHAPLRTADAEIGALYVDSRDNAFDLSLVGPEFFNVYAGLAANALSAARSHDELRANVAALKEDVDKVYRHDDLIGDSPAMQEVFGLVDRVKDADTTVLVLGESGTGKERIARLIHHQGPRSDKPFIAVNCAAIPSELLEAELFGIEGGTATGVSGRVGKFEAANHGTIFLDEVGDLSGMAQAKLLRVLQEKTVEKVGSHSSVELDVRVVAATNVDLRDAVEAREFREDLYYRLNVLPIYLPALRERREDVPLLVRYYVERFCAEQKKTPLHVPDAVMDSFVRANWRGNIRELKNALERAVILSDGDTLVPHVEMGQPSGSGTRLDLQPALELQLSERDLVCQYAKRAFDRFGRYDLTSDFLGISFKTLKKRLQDAEEPVAAAASR